MSEVLTWPMRGSPNAVHVAIDRVQVPCATFVVLLMADCSSQLASSTSLAQVLHSPSEVAACGTCSIVATSAAGAGNTGVVSGAEGSVDAGGIAVALTVGI